MNARDFWAALGARLVVTVAAAYVALNLTRRI